MKNRLVLCFSTLMLSLNVVADCSEITCSDVYVEKLVLTPSLSTVKIGTSGVENSLTCTPISNYYLPLEINSTTGKETYSALLAAQMASKKVNIQLFSGTGNCVINYISISAQ